MNWSMSRHPRLVLLALMVIGVVLMTPPATAAFKYLTEGMDAPNIKGVDIYTGETVSTRKLARDNLVIVIFWSSWSERSIEELKDIGEIMKDYADQPIKVVGVNVDGQNLSAIARQNVEATIANLALPYPMIIDDKLEFFYQFGVIAVPSTAVIDTSRTLRYGPAGYSLTTRDRLVDSIQIFLGLKQPDTTTKFREGYRPKKRSSRFYNMALNLRNIRMYERALAVIDSAMTTDTLFSAPWSLRGEILLKLNRADEAVTNFAQSVARDSMLVAGWAGWGRALMKTGQLDEAQIKLSHTLELDAAYTPAFLDLGYCLAQLGKPEEAIDSLEKARDLNRVDPIIYWYLGQVHNQNGNRSKAIESFIATLDLIYPSD